jgi:dihydropteroate synthase/2-amino-4-hydroxy-6-hydroxymethyldihydropteridine diphosphokinase
MNLSIGKGLSNGVAKTVTTLRGGGVGGGVSAFFRRPICSRGRSTCSSTVIGTASAATHTSLFDYGTNAAKISTVYGSIANRTKTTMTTITQTNQQPRRPRRRYQVYLAVGSNQGDSFQNIVTGLELLCDPGYESESYSPTEFVRSSFLYYTAPMYVKDQDSFWNGACLIHTDYDPSNLLRRLKLVEEHLGRNFTHIRNGPRPLDLDILLYYDAENGDDDKVESSSSSTSTSTSTLTTTTTIPVIVDTAELTIPHQRIQEREFVLAPLVEVAGRNCIHPTVTVPSTSTGATTLGDLLDNLMKEKNVDDDGNNNNKSPSATRLIPLPRKRFLLFDQTLIMGILNVTPDSFSDGGKWTSSIDRAVSRAIEMVDEGASIIDIGGESTRPGAAEILVEEQIRRTVPVIEAIRKKSADVILSIDTRHAAVARAAIEAGADIVNDVSAGAHDPDMFATVAEMGVPIILMHMRGTPKSMQDLTNYDDEGNVLDGVVRALLERSRLAEEAGISKWMQILDPGIGFAKDNEGNLSLLKHYSDLRTKLDNFPLLLGTSRKRFIGKITGETKAEERDFGTVGSCVAALCLGNNGRGDSLGCNILRVHNVKGAKQATAVMDAIVKAC